MYSMPPVEASRGGSRGGVSGVATPPNESKKHHRTVYKAYYSLQLLVVYSRQAVLHDY